jgi:hypothetical protein
MKTNYYLILISFLLCTSCQEQYSDADIQRQLHWNETIQRSSPVLKKNKSLAIEEVKAYTKLMTQYHALYPKFKYTTTLADTIYNDLEQLKQALIEDSGDHASIARVAQTKALTTSIQSVYNEYLQLMETSWDKGGIKGTVFADPSKKEKFMQEIKEKLDLPFISQIRQDSSQLERLLKGKPLAAALTLLSAVQNDIRKQEFHAFDFFARQISRMCNFGWSSGFSFCSLSSKSCIRLGETYEVDHLLGGYYYDSIRSVTLDGVNLPLEDNRGIYAVKPAQVGEQVYRPTITFFTPYTNSLDSITKSFYFDVVY